MMADMAATMATEEAKESHATYGGSWKAPRRFLESSSEGESYDVAQPTRNEMRRDAPRCARDVPESARCDGGRCDLVQCAQLERRQQKQSHEEQPRGVPEKAGASRVHDGSEKVPRRGQVGASRSAHGAKVRADSAHASRKKGRIDCLPPSDSEG